VLGLGVLSLVLVTAFVLRQARVANPLMPLRLFRSRNLSGANLVLILLVVGMFSMFFLGALYMQQVLGYDPLEVGLAFLPGTIVMGTMSLYLSGPIAMRFGAKPVVVVCLAAMGGAMVLFARTPVDGSYVVDLLPIMLLFGFGAGLAFPVLMQLAMSGVAPTDMGLASGLANTSPQIGGAVGLAVLATLAADRTEALLANGDAALAALNGGFHSAYLVGAALVLVAIAVAVTVLKPMPQPMMGPGEAPEGAHEREGEPAYSEA
jgi:predicted MFS family arabinose efflux permease